MQFSTLPLLALLGVVSAGFSADCTHCALNQGFLYCECKADVAYPLVSTRLDLNAHVSSTNGDLHWGSGSYNTACNSCVFTSGHMLQCDCGAGTVDLDLDEHIANEAGHLTYE